MGIKIWSFFFQSNILPSVKHRNWDLIIFWTQSTIFSSANNYFTKNRDFIIDKNLFWAQSTILIPVNHSWLRIEMWLYIQNFLGQSAIMHLVNHISMRTKVWLYFKPIQPYRAQSSLLHWELRFDRRFKLILSTANYFDSS